ncbi:MAG: tetratricopeptide repeat protein [Bacteroidetes bacterium]|nr:tetratricopeptide repeat protein [Bacteroidota bacterium]
MRKIPFLFFISVLSLSLLSACSGSKKSASSNSKQKTKSESRLTDSQRMDFERTFYNANKEKMLNNFKEAAALFRKCLQIDPSNAAAMYELANLLFVGGDYVNAESLSHSACLIQPKNEWYQTLYGNSLLRNKKYAEATKVQEKLVENFPNRVDFKYELVNRYYNLEKYDDALKTLIDIESYIGINQQITEQKARIYLKQDKLDKAIAEYQKLIDSNPTEVNYYLSLAEMYAANNMDAKAMEEYELVKKIDPQNAFVHLYLSHYYGKSKQPAKAFEEMKMAFQNSNLDLDVKIKELLRYYTNAEFNDTVKSEGYQLLDIVIQSHPTESNAFSIYGDFLYRDKKIAEAKEKYTKAVELEKDRLAVWSQLLFIESQLSDYTSMLKDSKAAMELFPSEPTLFFFNGVANLQLSDNKAAISALKKGVDLVVENKPLEGQFYANLGDAYYRDKQMGKSDSAYERALEINPNDTYVLNNYSYYLSLRNVDLDKAQAMSRKANDLDPNNGNSQDTYAWILYASAKYVDAKEWIEKAIQNGGEKNAVILEHYGDILFKLNEKNKALEYWIKAKEAGKGSDFLEKKINEKTLFE